MYSRRLNDGWTFALFPLYTSFEEIRIKSDKFYEVGIPHDWLIFNPRKLYADGMGWYYRNIVIEEIDGLDIFLRFEGVYMDTSIYLNGKKIGEWKYGYTTFEVCLTEGIKLGENEIFVSVNYQAPNSRWYSGAGIYRDVWLKILPKEHILADGIYFSTKKRNTDWEVWIDSEVSFEITDAYAIRYMLTEVDTGKVCTLIGDATFQGQTHSFHGYVENPKIWDVDAPYRYVLSASLEKDGCIIHRDTTRVGFRSFAFYAEKGFFLNGRHVKLHGTCEHHDLGLFGVAFHEKALRRRFKKLKAMGVNALRTAHNMPAKGFMDLADEFGFLVVNEAFDTWELSKTPYDYARFFKEWYAYDIKSWIRRDRNHPSLLLWSIGNEIADTHITDAGADWCQRLVDMVSIYDSRKNANITLGSNYMAWDRAKESAKIVGIVGYNYGEKYYASHHRAYPNWILYGSETASIVSSRGIYHFPYQQSLLSDEDMQCSSLGNSITSWGAKSIEDCILADIKYPYTLGQFIWSGFDYIGEPTPYHTKNAYFGQLDTAGFEKDGYYMYQSAWTDYRDAPMIHIFPYWDFNEAQIVDVRVCSNAPLIELFLNGNSQGIVNLEAKNGKITGNWQIPYEEGELLAIAYDEAGSIIAKDIKTSFRDGVEISLDVEDRILYACGDDIAFLTITLVDIEGHIVENANTLIEVNVRGEGILIGTDNGDSTDFTPYQSNKKRLFSGKLCAVVKAKNVPGNIDIYVHARGMKSVSTTIQVLPARVKEGIALNAYEDTNILENSRKEDFFSSPPYVRNIKLYSSHGMHLYPENMETLVTAKLLPEDAIEDTLIWSIVDDAGIPVTFAKIVSVDRDSIRLLAKSDGSFRLRCMSKSGTDAIRIISVLEFIVTDLGIAHMNPYNFVSARLYSYGIGEIGNGNERGVATARDGRSVVGFSDIDFGKMGSDTITLALFALTDDPYAFHIYEGNPDAGGICIGTFVYQKPKIWNVYQEVTWKLDKRLHGICEISFVLFEKVHIKGFIFKKEPITDIIFNTASADHIYGDSFKRKGEAICSIGNNVTLEFTGLDFGEEGACGIRIRGRTPLSKQAIMMQCIGEDEEKAYMFIYEKELDQADFLFDKLMGLYTIRFVFLPGSNFDFYTFLFY